MPSPFPGMDPFIEGQLWADFHSDFIAALREALVPQLRPRYFAVIEERVYVEREPEQPRVHVRPDVTVTAGRAGAPATSPPAATSTSAISIPLAMPESQRETYIAIRTASGNEVVTVIELLSPANKRPHGDGRREYLDKRSLILLTAIHLVELDLLRGGERLPMAAPLPPASAYAIASRATRRPMAEVWPIQLQGSLPVIGVPLGGGDPDVQLDLQAVFNAVYDRAGYDYMLDYERPVEPALAAEDASWVEEMLKSAQGT